MTQLTDTEPFCTLSGKIIYGRGIGKLVGVPTANLQLVSECSLPPVGVYITEILLDHKLYYGVTNIGSSPTIDSCGDTSIETFILNFNQDIYGQTMEIRLFKKLRRPQKFENFSKLLDQIRLDCTAAQEFFGIKQVSSPLHMSIQKHQAKLFDRELYLSVKEFDVLYMLYSNPDVTFTKERIYEAIWHEPCVGHFHAVENTVFQIRKKCRALGAETALIKTIPGYGYRFNLSSLTSSHMDEI